jgi:L-threonylcarbamoyladenylate synthase
MPEAELFKAGKVGVVPTDTLYGLLASIEHEAAVRRVYELKHRSITKPCIILISSREELARFGIAPTEAQAAVLERHWPGPVSIVLACGSQVPEWLHGGTHTLALRLPADESLRALLRESGPLIAPSANPEGLPPATTVDEARAYFGDSVDFYIDGSARQGSPSTLISLKADGTQTVLR